ncbi:uncharacterized protein LOC142239496 [Haematobia irritans]|uniref:uncharacterized protein LOC142239496 n=1 Tax=Haematobia irritans TaxID=7368 RepID=UPI003F500448
MQVYNVSCSKYTTLVKRFDCSYNMIAKGRCLASAYFVFDREVDKDAEAHMLIYFTPSYRSKRSAKPVKFVDLKMNICDILTQPMRVPILKVLFDEMRRTSNIPNRCPIKGNFLYSVANFTIDQSLLPPYVPFVQFNFSLSFYEHAVKTSTLYLAGATVSRI